MEWWQLLLYILSIIILIWLALLVIDITNVLSFKGKLEKRTVAFSVLFIEKKDILLTIYAMFDEKKAEFSSSLNKAAAQVRWMKLESMKGEDIENNVVLLNDFEKRLALLGHKYPLFEGDKDYEIYWTTLEDLNANYRRNVANYNSEVLGYEYWRKFIIFRPFTYLFGFREKKRLN